MGIEIKDRWTNRVLYSSERETIKEAIEEAIAAGANLYGANLYGANLESANLESANLVRANLVRANLESANLVRANLYGANLESANLVRANLVRAKGVNLFQVQPMSLLHFQTGRMRALKLVSPSYESIHAGNGMTPGKKLKYEIGKHYEVDNIDTDIAEDCGAGLHVSAPTWILNHPGNRDYLKEGASRLLVVEFDVKDAVIPLTGNGKFRVKAFDVIEEIPLSSILPPKPVEAK